jgi:dihydroorotate dehydrogenase
MFDKAALWALHQFEPEDAHNLSIEALKLGLGPCKSPPQGLRRFIGKEGCGFWVNSPLGLAAGFDKNAEVPLAMTRAGFGFVEIGTVTPRPQAGNPKPRLFRLKDDQAVINRFGFNNQGFDRVHDRISAIGANDRKAIILGVNIGANKDSPDRVADYCLGLERFWRHADYFTLNVSSPNTPGLRGLQDDGALKDMLSKTAIKREELIEKSSINKPLFLKIAPDLSPDEIISIVKSALRFGLDGLIISNTTIARSDQLKSPFKSETGGLSGLPLFESSTLALRIAAEAASGDLILIGAGGIGSGEEAEGKLKAGASLVQLYSRLVYEGLGLVDLINQYLAKTNQ